MRWLLNDVPEQAALITDILNSETNISVADAAIIETVFVLEKTKSISRETVKKAVMAIIGNKSISCNEELFIEIFPLYIQYPKLSFVDCYLEVLARRSEAAPLLTFDQKLAKTLSGTQLLA